MAAQINASSTNPSRAASRRRGRAEQKLRRTRVTETTLGVEGLEERTVFALATVDLNFGSSGVVADSGYTWNSQAVQNDGKIVVVGTHDNAGDKDIAIKRLNANGSIDTTFGGGDGVVTVDLSHASDVGNDVAIDHNGNIVVVGTSSTNATTGSAVVVRLNGTTGALDTTFSGDGVQTVKYGPKLSRGESVAIDSLNRVVIAGTAIGGSTTDGAVARLTTAGNLDKTFSGDGIFNYNSGSDDAFHAVVVRAGDKIAAIGDTGSALLSDVRAVGITSTGATDLSFGTLGTTSISLSIGSTNTAADAAVDSQGRIVIASSTQLLVLSAMTVTRLNATGTVDSSFGLLGTSTLDLSVGVDQAKGIAVDGNDNVYVVGSSNGEIGVARLAGTTGLLDSLFNSDGLATLDLGNGVVGQAVAVTSNGISVLANGLGLGDVVQLVNGLGLTVSNLLNGSGPLNVLEGTPVGTVLGDLTGTGFPVNDVLTYVLQNNPGNLFSIVDGQLVLNGLLNYEDGAVQNVVVQVIDGLQSVTQTIPVIVNDVAPTLATDVNGLINSVPVGAVAGTLVGITAQATDVAGGAVSYLLTNDAGGKFVIDAVTGVVSVAAGAVISLVDGVYNIVVQATDGLLSSLTNLVINIVPALTPTYGLIVDGTVDSDLAIDVNEGQPAGTPVANLTGTGFGLGANLTYTLPSNPNNLFKIVGNQLQTNATFNFESGSTYPVTVQVSDGTNTFSQSVVVTVNNVAPDAPTDSNNAANTVLVGAIAGTTVGVTAASTDPAGGNVTFSLTNTAGGRFVIDQTTGIVSVAQGATFNQADGSYTITVRASDGQLTSATNFNVVVQTTATPVYGLTVNGNVDGDAAIDANENSATGTAVANLTGTGFAPGATLTYSLTSNPSNLFTIVGNQLRVNGLLNYEAGATRSVGVQVSDGVNTFSEMVDVVINNLAPTTPTDANPLANNVLVGSPVGTPVGVIASATDPAGGNVTYSLTNSAAGRFVIDPLTGIVTVAQGAVFNPADGSYNITVSASDGELSSTANFTIAVQTSVIPTYGLTVDGSIDGDPAVDVNEGAAVGTPIAYLTGTGFAPGSTLTYTLQTNPGNAFAIAGNVLLLNGTVNYESSATQTVSVQVSDGTNSYAMNVNINVNNLPPLTATDSNTAVNQVAVGAAAGTVVGVTVGSTDPAGGTVTYSLTNSAGGRFVIDPNTGVVTVANGAVFVAGSTYAITVQSSDGQLTSAAAFTIVGVPAPVTPVPGGVIAGPDSVDPNTMALYVYGTDGNDKISVDYKKGGYLVKINGHYVGGSHTLPVTTRIYIYGFNGNDSLQISSKGVNPVTIDGGAGNDVIKGGRGNDILIGGAGNDTISGGAGRDVIIGGTGVDKLTSTGSGSSSFNEGNLMIGDSTTYDSDLAALSAISAAWSLNVSTSEGVIRNYLNSTTVVPDGSIDQITGTTKGIDWTFGYGMSATNVRVDKLKSFSANDRIN